MPLSPFFEGYLAEGCRKTEAPMSVDLLGEESHCALGTNPSETQYRHEKTLMEASWILWNSTCRFYGFEITLFQVKEQLASVSMVLDSAVFDARHRRYTKMYEFQCIYKSRSSIYFSAYFSVDNEIGDVGDSLPWQECWEITRMHFCRPVGYVRDRRWESPW